MKLRIAILILPVLAVLATAQEAVPMPPCTTGRVVQVALTGTVSVAVSEKWRIAVFGHRGPTDQELTVVPLDATGAVEPGSATRVRLEKADSLKAFTASLPGLAFHPTLPLLYVWRDIAFPFPPKSFKENPVFRDFDHLAVFAVSNRTLSLVGSFARGPFFAYGQESGAIALSPSGRRLFVPNIRHNREKAGIGYLPLMTNGLPLLAEDGTVKLASVELPSMPAFPIGRGFACFNDQVAAVGGSFELVTWDTGNRLGMVSQVLLWTWPDSRVFVGCHPAIPAIYMAAGGKLGRIRAAGGYPSLLPVTLTVEGAQFASPPVPLSASPAVVAAGGMNAVYLRGIDPASGDFTGRGDQVVIVTNPVVRALAASAAWNRLYVPVEALP